MKLFTLLTFCVLTITSWAQQKQFAYTYGNVNDQQITSVKETSDGGYIMAGFTEVAGFGVEGYLLKLDEDGEEEWSVVTGGAGQTDDLFYDVMETSNGYAAVGYTESFSGLLLEMYLVQTDFNGLEQTTRHFGETGPDVAHVIQPTSDGGWVMAGRTYNPGIGEQPFNVILKKFAANQSVTWTYKYEEDEFRRAEDVIQTNDGGYLMAVQVEGKGFAGLDDFMGMVKVSSSGTLQWSRYYGCSQFGCSQIPFFNAESVVQMPDGGYLLGGWMGASNSNVGKQMIWLVKTSSSGIKEWDNGYVTPTKHMRLEDMELTNDGGIILTGEMNDTNSATNPGSRDGFLVKMDASGTVQWANAYGAPDGDDIGFDVEVLSDGGYGMAGISIGFDPDVRAYFVKTDADGNVGCDQTPITIEVVSKFDQSWAGSVVANSSLNFGGSDDFGTFEYSTLTNFQCLVDPELVNLGDDFELCGTTATLDAGPGFTDYLWSTGEVTQTIDVSVPGIYSVETTTSQDHTGIDEIELLPCVSSVADLASEAGLLIFPNPATDRIFLQRSAEGFASYDVRIVGVLGNVVYQAKNVQLSGEITHISIADLQQGSYWLELTEGTAHLVHPFLKL